MRKIFTFLCAALMSVGMYAATVVTITNSDIPSHGQSFTKDGVTVSAGSIDGSLGNLTNGGSFSTTLGNFTKIEIYAEMSPTEARKKDMPISRSIIFAPKVV